MATTFVCILAASALRADGAVYWELGGSEWWCGVVWCAGDGNAKQGTRQDKAFAGVRSALEPRIASWRSERGRSLAGECVAIL